jgi:hypothetical protein
MIVPKLELYREISTQKAARGRRSSVSGGGKEGRDNRIYT